MWKTIRLNRHLSSYKSLNPYAIRKTIEAVSTNPLGQGILLPAYNYSSQ
jgi:hypothetical protein